MDSKYVSKITNKPFTSSYSSFHNISNINVHSNGNGLNSFVHRSSSPYNNNNDMLTLVGDEHEQEPKENGEKKAESWFELDMSSMGLRVICKEITLYPHLTALYLSNNKLVDLPDEIFTELRSLTSLDVSFNLLSRLPPSIGNLENLEKLVIHQNRLAELPLELGKLFKLQDIQLDGNPITNLPASIMQAGAKMIVSYLRDRTPLGPPPPERRFISYVDPQTNIPDKEKFRVLTYNILAESYATAEHYFYCPSWALDWNYRKQGILKEISQHDGDIVCLQEVEAKQFSDFFQPEMAKLGYAGVFAPKSRARTKDDWGSVDGCVIFFKRARFGLVEQHMIEFQSIFMARHKEFTDDPEAFSRLMTKDNIAIAVVLQVKDAENPTASPSKNRGWANGGKSRHLLVANTHIHWNPEHKDVKLMQVQILLEELSALVSSKSRWHKIPVVVAGDFNSSVDSGPYELLANGKLKPRHPDLDPYVYGSYTSHGMNHGLAVSSAYGPIGEPQFTNCTGTFVGILDYIWFSHDMLAVSKVLQPVDEETVKATKLPNAYMHSDHIYLLTEFFYKNK